MIGHTVVVAALPLLLMPSSIATDVLVAFIVISIPHLVVMSIMRKHKPYACSNQLTRMPWSSPSFSAC